MAELDAGDFEVKCDECGAEFMAGDEVNDDGDCVVCPQCGNVVIDCSGD
jgi:DNA-directed RNA polymerase subunit RPC12/RpoP